MLAAQKRMRSENRVVLAHISTAVIALALGASLGLVQLGSRSGDITVPPWLGYYRILTLHGVLMALVFTTFFITGLALFVAYRQVPRERKLAVGWTGWAVMLLGTAMAAFEIFAGNASVLYTFYAPLKASPFFYLGATLLIVGTWIVAFEIFENVAYYRRRHAGAPLPLALFAITTTFVMWFIATLGVVAEMGLLLPWALGWTPGVNVMMTRLLFWYFGHPLVYFWIMGAYVIWYAILPPRYGGNVFSDGLTRLTFIMLLLLSTPVGIHHEFMEPGIATKWKLLFTIMTYGVAVPSFLTAFAIFASFEIAARRTGGRGIVAVVRSLPWNDPVFSGAAYGMLLFIAGGFGGLINASYDMDSVVHNTMWIVGHFHITVGGPAALTFLGATYWLLPRLTGRAIWKPHWAVWQTRLWFVGMAVMSFAMHFAGLEGAPRRTAETAYGGAAAAAAWEPAMLAAAAGGTIVVISVAIFVCVVIGTLRNDDASEDLTAQFATPVDPEDRTPPMLQHVFRWGVVALLLAIVVYWGPIGAMLREPGFLVPGMRTW